MPRRKLNRIPDKPRKGLVVVLTGDGKGKTTSCLGMAVRAVGYGMRVAMIQFVKGSLHYGELDGAKRLAPEFELTPMGKGFVGIMGDTLPFSEHAAAAGKALAAARKKMLSEKYDILILDEINVALKLGLLAALSSAPPGPSVARLASTPVSTASRRSPVRNAGCPLFPFTSPRPFRPFPRTR